MNEAEIRAEHIDPALKAAGWAGENQDALECVSEKIVSEDVVIHLLSAARLFFYCQQEDWRSQGR